MELYQLRTFAAVAQENHLTRAAERLHLSQPAVSGQIKALEQQFDVRLFERGPGGMQLTPAGRELLAHAHRVLGAAEELQRAARRLNSDDFVAGELSVGTLSDPTSIRLGDLLAAATRRHPQLDLHLHHEMSGAALEGVRDGRLDAAFYYGDLPATEFHAVSLRQFVYRVTAPAAWQSRVDAANWAGIAALPWVVMPSNSTHHRLVTRLFAEHGVPPPQRHVEADHESVIVSLVTSGVGASLMREDVALARARAGEVCVWQGARLRTTLWFVCQAERADDPLLRALLGVVRDVWGEKLAAVEAAVEAR